MIYEEPTLYNVICRAFRWCYEHLWPWYGLWYDPEHDCWWKGDTAEDLRWRAQFERERPHDSHFERHGFLEHGVWRDA